MTPDDSRTPNATSNAPLSADSTRPGGLKRAAVRGWVVTMSGQAAKFVIQLGSTAVIARQLSPTDYGLVAMVTSLLGFVALFKDLGLSQASIQRESITSAQVNGLFWINVAVGLFFAVLIALVAPLVGRLYGHPELTWITLAFAAMTPVSSLGAQHSAMLQRNLKYSSLAIRDVAASLGGAVTGIVATLHGYGYWSLVIMQAASALFSTATLWWKSDWRPGLPNFSADLKPFLKFGSTVTLSSFLGFLMNGLDSVLLGYFVGPVGLGIYNRAQNTLSRPLQQLIPPVMNVASSVFARAAHDQRKFEDAALQVGFLIAAAGGLVAAISMAYADWIVLIILGPNWAETVPIVRILSLFAMVEPMASLLATLLVARGLPGILLRWRVVSASIILVGFFAGLPWGPLGIATAYSLSGFLIRMPLFTWYASRHLGIQPRRMLQTAILPVAAGVGVVVAMHLSRLKFGSPTNTPLSLLLYATLGTAVYIALLLLFPSGRKHVNDAVNLLKQSFRSKKI